MREHGDGRIVIKCNSIVDPAIIAALYRASEARRADRRSSSAACARSDRASTGVSETIRVRSVVGRYLEHSRIFVFGSGERERFYIGSADIMERNLDRRVEALAPVDDPASQASPARDHRCDARRRPARVAARLGRSVAARGRDRRSAIGDRYLRDHDDVGAGSLRRNFMSSARRAAARPSTGERELELKYAVADVDAVRELVSTAEIAGFEAGPWRAFDIVDQYLDTHSGALARAGYGARLRHVDHRTLVTIKGARRSTGGGGRGAGNGSRRSAVHDRLELEARANRRLLPERWPSSAARSLIEATAGDERLLHALLRRPAARGARVAGGRRGCRQAVARHGQRAPLRPHPGQLRHPRGRGAARPSAAETRRSLESIAAFLAESPELRAEERSKEQLAQAMVDQAKRARAAP